MNHEVTVLLINGIVLLTCYLIVLPRWAGADLNRIALHDFFASVVALIIAGSLYQGMRLRFDFGPFTLNWFWFTLLTYFAMELPLVYWYLRRTGAERE